MDFDDNSRILDDRSTQGLKMVHVLLHPSLISL